MEFTYLPQFRPDLPPPAERWTGFAEYNFIGGHNDADNVPVAELAAAAADALEQEGRLLATYGLESGAQGYQPLRQCIADKLRRRAGLSCAAEEVLVTSGSLQALDLVNEALLAPGDTVIVEAATYAGTLTRLRRRGVEFVGVGLDDQGIRCDQLAAILESLSGRGVRPKFVYTIPTVQNPTGSVMSLERRRELLRLAAAYGLTIFEDDCYADLLWSGERPPAIRALDADGRVIYCGSFSKSVAPALRVGYIVADWPVMRRLLPLKTDGGSGALEQIVLARYAAGHFDAHVASLAKRLEAKCAVMIEALEAQFGAVAEISVPRGGIFIWVTLPDAVDTSALARAALADGVALNPGAEWSADPAAGRNSLRLCFGHPSETEIREGVARLAEICHRETGIPVRSANVQW